MNKTAITFALLSASLSTLVNAGWYTGGHTPDANQSRPFLDRVNRTYVAVITLTNNSSDNMDGPFRIILRNATMPVANADGYTSDGAPYLMVYSPGIAPGESITKRASFELRRNQLNFTTEVQAVNELTGIYAEAEGGGEATLDFIGADLRIETGSPTFVTTNVDATIEPSDDSRVGELSVDFPSSGEFSLYARVRIGENGSDDDSFYAPSSLRSQNDWVMINSISGQIVPGEPGYSPGSIVGNSDVSTTSVFMWVKVPEIVYRVETDGVFTFRYASREDGLDIDKFAFAPSDLSFTVEQLENMQPGTSPSNEEVYIPQGPPLAAGKGKFLGGVCCGSQAPNFTAYWNQVTPENAGKWGSVEAVRGEFNWAPLDEAYNLAKDNGFIYKHHVLVWGSQQPSWLSELPPAEQLVEINEWFEAVNSRYPAMDFIEVVNEFDNAPPDGENGRPDYVDALRLFDPGTTSEIADFFIAQGSDEITAAEKADSYDWIVNAFQMARNIFPATSKLMFNEYSVVNSAARTDKVIELANLLQSRGLIDAVGFQGHAFSTTGPATTLENNINRIESQTGLDIYLTELDIDGTDELAQLLEYQRLFPIFWEHPGIKGITMWGYLPGHWREEQGAILAYNNGVEKAALVWLKGYMRGLAPHFEQPPVIQTDEDVTTGTSLANFSSTDYAGNPHLPGDNVVWTVLGGNDNNLFNLNPQTGNLTVAAPLTAGLHTLYIQVREDEYTSYVRGVQIAVDGENLPPVVTEYDFSSDAEGWRGDYGTSASVIYDSSIPAAMLVPDWSSSNSQEYIQSIPLTDLNGATITYKLNVTQEQVDGGMTLQPYVQLGDPPYTRLYGSSIQPQAGENTVIFEPEDNAAGDLANISRLAFQLNGPLSQGTSDNVALTYVSVSIPSTLPATASVVYDFSEDAGGMRGDYGSEASVVYRSDKEAISLQPNGTNNTHNYIMSIPSRDFSDTALTFSLYAEGDAADGSLSVQAYVQTGAPAYSRIYGAIEPLSPGSNHFTFYPQEDDSGSISNIERIAIQVNGTFTGEDGNEILLERIEVDFP